MWGRPAEDANGSGWGTVVPGIVIRWAGETDAEAVHAVVRAAFGAVVVDPPSGALRDTVEDVRAAMRAGRVAVAEVPGVGVVGSIRCVLADDHVYLARLGVLPDWQGHGIGRALMAFVEGYAREVGVPEARLGTRASQPTAAAYQRWGYEVTGRTPHGPDEVLWMRKRLSGCRGAAEGAAAGA